MKTTMMMAVRVERCAGQSFFGFFAETVAEVKLLVTAWPAACCRRVATKDETRLDAWLRFVDGLGNGCGNVEGGAL